MTEKQLTKILNTALAAQTVQIMEQVDQKLAAQTVLVNAGFAAQDARIDARFKEEIGPLAEMISHIYNLLDADAKDRSTEQQERAAMGAAQVRHSGWIVQLAKHTNAKLVPEPK